MSVKSSGTMPSLSHIKNSIRKFKYPPRPGQQRALRALAKHRDFLNVKLPTGYGKTYVAMGAYCILRDAGLATRNLIVVPTTAQLEQLKDASLSDYGLEGEIIDVGFYGTQAIEKHRKNDGHIFAVTIQSLLKNAGLIVDSMMSDGSKWMVTVDEHHHYGIGLPFSNAVMDLPGNFRLVMSATPMRPKDDLCFGDPNVSVSYRDAEKEGVVKELRGEAYYYVLDLVDEDGEIRSVSTEELAEEAGGDSPDKIESLIIKRRMRWSPKYISPLISTPLCRLMNTRLRTGKRAKAIVGAMCVSHAELICKQINTTFPGLNADWVGTGENGRSTKENKSVVNAFRNGQGADVLVHVGIAGEGLDVPEITEVIHCNNAGVNVGNNQENGRGARSSEGLKVCHVSFDSSSQYAVLGYVGKAIMDAMEFNPPSDGDEDIFCPDDENDDGEWDDLPDELIEIENIRLDRIDNGDPEVIEITRRLSSETFVDLDVSEVMADQNHPLRDLVAGLVLEIRNNQAEKLSEEHNIEKLSADLKQAVNVLAGNVVRRVCKETGMRFDRAMIGDVCKRIRTKLKRECGPVVKDLEKLRNHYATLKSYEVQIKAGEVPSWLK